MINRRQTVSVIVPAFRQARTIGKDLIQIEEALAKIPYDHEIICVVDGLSGRTDRTLENAKKVASPKIKIVGYEKNRGKGYAVRYGMARAKGEIVAFIDSGMDIDPRAIAMLLAHMEWYGSDVVVGSVRHSASMVVGYPMKRRVCSWGYHALTKLLFGLKVTDSQRGVKLFKREVLERVLPRLLVKKFAFDIEMLAVARRLGFKKIHDGPVIMDARKMKYSSIKKETIIEMFLDTLAVFYRLYLLRYYDDAARRRWVFDPDLNFRVNLP